MQHSSRGKEQPHWQRWTLSPLKSLLAFNSVLLLCMNYWTWSCLPQGFCHCFHHIKLKAHNIDKVFLTVQTTGAELSVDLCERKTTAWRFGHFTSCAPAWLLLKSESLFSSWRHSSCSFLCQSSVVLWGNEIVLCKLFKRITLCIAYHGLNFWDKVTRSAVQLKLNPSTK